VAFGAGRWPAPRLLTYLVVANIGLAGKAAVFVHFCCFSVCISEYCFIAESAGNQMFGCNAVQDTLLQATASSNKGVSVGCKKVRLVVRLKADSRISLYSSEITLLQPLDRVFKPLQHRLRNSTTDAQSRACRTSVNYALIYSRSGTLTTMMCLATSRSSHTVAGGSCGHAPIVQQDALMSGRQLCPNVQEEPNAHIVKGERYASTTLSLPRHQGKSNIGTRKKTPTHQSRRLLAAVFGLNGSAKSAAMSGKLESEHV